MLKHSDKKDHPIYSSYEINDCIEYNDEIKPQLSAAQIAAMDRLTNEILQATEKLYDKVMSSPHAKIAFFEVRKDYQKSWDDGRDFFQTKDVNPDSIRSLYVEMIKCKIKSVKQENRELYGEDIAVKLLDLSNTCSVFLKKELEAQEIRWEKQSDPNRRKVHFDPETKLSSSDDSSPKETNTARSATSTPSPQTSSPSGSGTSTPSPDRGSAK